MQKNVVDFLRKYVQTSILKRMKKDLADKSFRKNRQSKCLKVLKRNV